jgi:hypothetical protein
MSCAFYFYTLLPPKAASNHLLPVFCSSFFFGRWAGRREADISQNEVGKRGA